MKELFDSVVPLKPRSEEICWFIFFCCGVALKKNLFGSVYIPLKCGSYNIIVYFNIIKNYILNFMFQSHDFKLCLLR